MQKGERKPKKERKLEEFNIPYSERGRFPTTEFIAEAGGCRPSLYLQYASAMFEACRPSLAAWFVGSTAIDMKSGEKGRAEEDERLWLFSVENESKSEMIGDRNAGNVFFIFFLKLLIC